MKISKDKSETFCNAIQFGCEPGVEEESPLCRLGTKLERKNKQIEQQGDETNRLQNSELNEN